MEDSLRRDDLRRDDLRPTPVQPVKYVSRMHWGILRGDGSGLATQRLYPAARAKRFVRLAKRWGYDVYTTRFGKVRLPA